MHAALRSYVTEALALVGVSLLVGASLIGVTPVTPPATDIRVEHLATRLLASTSSSIANIPVNLLIDIVNIPYYESLAIEEYAYALGPAGSVGGVPGWIPSGATVANGGAVSTPAGLLYALGGTGSWYMESIGNTWGWDNGNWPQLDGILHFFLPFAFTESLAEQLQTFAQAELPAGSGVNCEFECANLLGYLGGWLSLPVPLTALLSGTTFPTTQTNTIGQNSPTGVINVGPPGSENVAIWSGQPAVLNPLAPLQAIAANLTGSPANNPIMFPDLAALIENVDKLSVAFNYLGFNPFVQGSFLYWGASTLYSVPAALGGLVQSLTGIPNQFLIPPWQPNGAMPITGYTASLPQLVEGLPQGFEYLLTGLLGYVSPTLAADLSGPLNALGNLGTLPANLLESSGIAALWLLPTTTLPSALANFNTQVAQVLASLVSGLGGGSLSTLVNNLSGTGTTGSSATGLASLVSGLGGALSTLVNNLLGTGSTGSSATGLSPLVSGMNLASVLALMNSLLGTGSTGSLPGISSLLSGPGGGSLSTLVNNLLGTASTTPAAMSSLNTKAPTMQSTVTTAAAPPSTPDKKPQSTTAQSTVTTATSSGDGQTLDPPSTPDKKPQRTTSTSTDVTVGPLTDGPGGTSTNGEPHVISGGNMAEPGGKVGRTSTTSGGNSFSERLDSAVSQALGGKGSDGNGGGAKTPSTHGK